MGGGREIERGGNRTGGGNTKRENYIAEYENTRSMGRRGGEAMRERDGGEIEEER